MGALRQGIGRLLAQENGFIVSSDAGAAKTSLVLSVGAILNRKHYSSDTSISDGPTTDKDGWISAMDKGDWDAAWELFSAHTESAQAGIPSFEELLKRDPESEEKYFRRKYELDMQESAARARVRRVDQQGIAHGVGKRKTSVARVWIREGAGHCMVNKEPYDSYFPDIVRRNDIMSPLVVANALGKFDVMALVEGGGSMGQSQAVRHGLAKALENWDPDLREELQNSGLLSRDTRIVERKKPGRKKARKSFQWVKR